MDASSINQSDRWTGDQVWDGRQLESSDSWVFRLSEDDLAILKFAIDASSHKAVGSLTLADFALPQLAGRLTQLRDEILQGKGFALIRGLPAAGWSDEELVRAYWGLGTWLGDPVPQNAKAHLLGHVIDQRAAPTDETRLYQTSAPLSFHSDSCDTVGLLCLQPAQSGGASALASSSAIYNWLLDADPDYIACLSEFFCCDRYGEIPQGKAPFYEVRIFNNIDNQIVCCGMDPDIRSAQRLKQVPPLTARQSAALDRFQSAAQRLSLTMDLQRGDIQLVNNLTVVHSRAAYVDHKDPARRRHMMRLWLSSPLGRALPSFLSERWGNIAVGGIRGGIRVPGARPAVNLHPDH